MPLSDDTVEGRRVSMSPALEVLRSRQRDLCLAFSLLLLACVTACASLGGLPVDDTAFEFELQGRVALHYGNEGGSARINWRHAAASDDLMVTNPIGQGIARITRQQEEVRLVTAEGREFHARDAETLTESVLGWRLPLAGLPDWVRARPIAGRPFQENRDEKGVLKTVSQDDWTIEYLAWEGALPSRLTLSRRDEKQSIEIRLVIDKWTNGPGGRGRENDQR